MGRGFGKVILLGEHAVVYGHPALAGAIDADLECRVHRGGANAAPLHLQVPAWSLAVEVGGESESDDDGDGARESEGDGEGGALGAAHARPARALRALIAALGADLDLDVCEALGPVRLEVHTALPPAAGLGSSAALSVAVVRALAGALGRSLDDDAVARVADSAERCFHHQPSGVDVALATRGGLGVYRRGHGLTKVAAAPLEIAVGLSGRPRSTARMVAQVAAARSADPAHIDPLLAHLGGLADSGAAAVTRGDVAVLGAAMTEAQRGLAELALSCPEIDQLCRLAEAAGAAGAKLTGAGGGGAVIAVATREDALPAILDAWQRAGFHGFRCRVGATAAPHPGPTP